MVLIRPMRFDSHAATGNENALSTLESRRRTGSRPKRQVEALEQPERQQRLHDEAAGKSIDAEQRRELVDDAARRPERGLRRRWRRAL